MSEDDYGGSWEDYSSQFMFPGDGPECSCEHETVEHGYAASWTHT